MGLEIRPITLRAANAYVAQYHRHNLPTNGHKWSLAVYETEDGTGNPSPTGGRLCGVAIAGQPIARKLDDGLTIEIRRVCTDGTRNACSILYGACARTAKAMGYKRVITYTLISETGTSLRASGFTDCGEAGGVPGICLLVRGRWSRSRCSERCGNTRTRKNEDGRSGFDPKKGEVT